MNRLALFDCDGTLVDSGAAICAAMGSCFSEAGLPVPPSAEVRRVVGLSLVEAVRRLWPDGDRQAHVALGDGYKRAFWALRAAGDVQKPLFDGIGNALAALEDAGWLLGVATGKSDRGLGLCLDHHGLKQRFVTLQTADRHPSKPHPAMALAAMAEAGATHGVMIGDTSFDIEMAKAAGLAAIGVAWGYHEPDELLAVGADAVAEHPSELPALLERHSVTAAI